MRHKNTFILLFFLFSLSYISYFSFFLSFLLSCFTSFRLSLLPSLLSFFLTVTLLTWNVVQRDTRVTRVPHKCCAQPLLKSRWLEQAVSQRHFVPLSAASALR